MRIVLVGAVESSLVALEGLMAVQKRPDLVITLPHAALHRHSDSVDLTSIANRNGIQVFHTTDINSPETCETLMLNPPDLIFVIGWSQLCGKTFRSLARLGCIGSHPAPLPRMRGRAVIPWTILIDEKTSGTTLFWLDDGMDSGDILLQQTFTVSPDETAKSLYAKHKDALRSMIPDAVALIQSGTPPRMKQDHQYATYCARRRPEDGLINWREPAAEIGRFIRAVGAPYPGAFSSSNGEILYVDAAVPISNSHQFVGLPGQVQSHTDRGFIVRCGDGICLEVTSWRWRGDKKPLRHAILGGDN
jgi:methionyl-tRNA formyltransferase